MKKTRIVIHPANPDGSICLQAQYKGLFFWHVIEAAWIDYTAEGGDTPDPNPGMDSLESKIFGTREECISYLKKVIDNFHTKKDKDSKKKTIEILVYPNRTHYKKGS